MSNKAELRAQLIAAHHALTPKQVETASKVVAKELLSTMDWSSVRTILAYHPFEGEHEIDPSYILRGLTGKVVDFVEPQLSAPFPATQYDVVLVPCVGFDDANYRLGRGGGWYDRLLASQKHATYIGLGYTFAHIKNLPHEPHDVPLHFIVQA